MHPIRAVAQLLEKVHPCVFGCKGTVKQSGETMPSVQVRLCLMSRLLALNNVLFMEQGFGCGGLQGWPL